MVQHLGGILPTMTKLHFLSTSEVLLAALHVMLQVNLVNFSGWTHVQKI